MNDVFDQDNALYPEYNFSIMTISSHWMLRKRVSSEGGIGEFLFEILAKRLDGRVSPLIALLQASLNDDNDDITKLVKPIIVFPSEKEKRKVDGVEYPEDSEIAWDSIKLVIRNGFDRLTENMKATGEAENSLAVLERVINYAIFATYLYLTQCNSAVYNGVKPPIVIDACIERESIRKASEQSYTLAKRAVEDYFTNAIYSWLKPVIAADNYDKCLEWIASMLFSTKEREDSIKPAIKSYFEGFCEDGASPLNALAKAIQIALYTFQYQYNSPSDFCRILGVRSGLIGPKGNRAKLKRYLLNSFTLETITLSILTADELSEGIELKELGERLYKYYNIFIGADAEKEYELLKIYNISQATPGDLRGDLNLNAQQLAKMYISLGLAKQYADGVALIGRGL